MTQSARGLFRATGKTGHAVAARLDTDLLGTVETPEYRERESDDFYPTPPEPTRALLHAEAGRLRDFATVWEPACGDGAMVRDMEAAGLDVFALDLVDRGCNALIRSFYGFDAMSRPSRAIVTNPPFDQCNWRDGKARWIRHALETCRVEYMALLMSWSWPAAGGLARLWATHPPARVYLMRWKIDFTGQGAPPMSNGWFVWDRAHAGETVLRMMDRDDARQCRLFDGEAAE